MCCASHQVALIISETDDPNAILCAYPVNNCVMKFTYSELANGKSNLTVLKEPGCASFIFLADRMRGDKAAHRCKRTELIEQG